MNRIQQILSKAERDGTARRLGSLEEIPVAAVPRLSDAEAAARGRTVVVEASPEAPAEEVVDSFSYATPASARVSNDATLDPVLVAALQPFSAAAEQYRSLRGRI